MSIIKIVSSLYDTLLLPHDIGLMKSIEQVLSGLELIGKCKNINVQRICSVHELNSNFLNLRATSGRTKRNMQYSKDIETGLIGAAI